MKTLTLPVIYTSSSSIWSSLFYEFYSGLIILLDFIPGRMGRIIRGFILGLFFKSAGNNLQICRNVTILDPSHLSIGHHSGFNTGCYISARGGLEIGNNVLIGPHVLIVTREHMYSAKKTLIKNQGWKLAPIRIEDDVWISGNVTITSGVILGKGSVIAAGAVVTQSVKPYTLVGGVPAKLISKRD